MLDLLEQAAKNQLCINIGRVDGTVVVTSNKTNNLYIATRWNTESEIYVAVQEAILDALTSPRLQVEIDPIQEAILLLDRAGYIVKPREAEPKRPARFNRIWDCSEEQLLKAMYLCQTPMDEMIKRLQRSKGGILDRLCKMRLVDRDAFLGYVVHGTTIPCYLIKESEND